MTTSQEKEVNQSASENDPALFNYPALLVESPKARCRQHPDILFIERR